MSLDTYGNLKTEIGTWLTRVDLTSDIDTLIDLFESWANRNLRVRQMEEESTTAAAEYLAFPTDFLELRDIQYQANPRRQLEYVTPTFADLYDSSGAAGTPVYYTFVGNQIRLIPAPDSTTDVRIAYYQTIPALSNSQTTNWLLTAYPDAYLYGALMHGKIRISDPQLAAFIADNFGQVVAEIQKAGRRSNVGGSLRVQAA